MTETQPTPDGPQTGAQSLNARRRRFALAANAVGPALNAAGHWLPLSVREAIARAVLAAADGEGAPASAPAEAAEEGCGATVDCEHPADEHSVYGCADGCACEWMPKQAAQIRHVPRLAGPEAEGRHGPTPEEITAACTGTEGFCDVHGYDRHPPAPDGLRDLYAAAIEADLEQFFRDHPEEPRNSPWVCGMRDAAAAVRAETATADQLRADVQRDRDRLREQLAEARGQIERVRKAVTERRTELAEYEAEHEPSAWSDAVSVTCSRIEDALRIFPESGGIPCNALTPKDPS